MIDLHIHGMAHGDYEHSCENLEKFIKTGLKKNITLLGFSEHDEYLNEISFDVLKELDEEYSDISVLVGLEVDHMEGKHIEINDRLQKFSFDYLIGSIHYVDGWPFDHPDYAGEYENWDIAKLYSRYFALIEDLINSGIYDIIGHLDLIKINGHRPKKDIEEFVFPVLELASRKDMVLEVNTSGLYKPVGEIYPSRRILEICKYCKVHLTLGSDAHTSCNVGRDIKGTCELLRELGYKEVVSFKAGVPQIHYLDEWL